MYYFFKLFCLSIVVFNLTDAEDTGNKPPFIFKKFENCVGMNLAVTFNDINMEQADKNTFILNGEVNNAEEIGPDFVGTISASHCIDPNNPDSCEYLVRDYEFGYICELIEDSSGTWNKFLDHLKIARKCPIPPGSYKIVNLKSVNEFQEKLPIPGGLWKVEMKGSINDVVKACVYLEFII